ncbi:di-heme-cytochrome C peroxidase [Sphingomonas sp. NFX23]|uniref:di-heme-cytochrome C peroxidase n=1 Tax=Sphingomonas sp. NFX23 TaxID=2819532 RepID=UPI003CF9C5CE
MFRYSLGVLICSTAVLIIAACSGVAREARLEQGWTAQQRLLWYHGNQGSRLAPRAWLAALESPADGQPFFTIERMETLGYLAPDANDASGLPIGFAVDRGPDDKFERSRLRWFDKQPGSEPWIGMNCAACHTGEIRNGGARLRIDGAPGMGDFQSFIEQLDAALQATVREPARFDRFAKRVLNERDNIPNRTMLRNALQQLVIWQARVQAMNQSSSRYGLGRLDAFGHIFNKVAIATGANQEGFEAPANAPVSYPFIWNVPQHDIVQWNRIAPNKGVRFPSGETFDIGAIGRNTGEVIGVFADVKVTRSAGIGGYVSSVNVANLDAMEEQLTKLYSPSWPQPFGTPAQDAVRVGAKLFRDQCSGCHKPLARTDLSKPIIAQMSPIWGGSKPVGTDPWMACNAFTYRARTGVLEGGKTALLAGTERFGPLADHRQILTATVIGTLAGKKPQILKTSAKAFFGLPRVIEVAGLAEPENAQKPPEERLALCKAAALKELMAYKARPLNGIWATAPYLHNGSVKSLTELLLPPAKRARSFPVGGRVLDTVNVGFLPEPGKPIWTFNVVDPAGREIPGNSNDGHDYGNAALTSEDRRALVEYMKTL